MKLPALLVATLIFCTHAFAQQIALSATIDFTLGDGSTLTLKQGQVVKATGTKGYYWVVPYSKNDVLLISGDDAGEMHRAFRDRSVEQLYLAICADLRDQKIVATHARVMRILDAELAERDRDLAIRQLSKDISRLETQTRQLENDIRERFPRR